MVQYFLLTLHKLDESTSLIGTKQMRPSRSQTGISPCDGGFGNVSRAAILAENLTIEIVLCRFQATAVRIYVDKVLSAGSVKL